MIHLYRRPLLDEWVETGVSLEELITHVIVHEEGHHFGFRTRRCTRSRTRQGDRSR
jgi:predicted Zn-dependent protease with MMP-like domain